MLLALFSKCMLNRHQIRGRASWFFGLISSFYSRTVKDVFRTDENREEDNKKAIKACFCSALLICTARRLDARAENDFSMPHLMLPNVSRLPRTDSDPMHRSGPPPLVPKEYIEAVRTETV